MIIVPAILTSNKDKLQKRLRLAEKVSKRVHLDFIDGEFAPKKSIDFDNQIIKDTKLDIDLHLMTDEPVSFLNRAVKIASTAIGQIEMMSDQKEFISQAEDLGLMTGLAIDIGTPIEEINQDLLPKIDIVLIMSVRAGEGGQKFIQPALEKIKQLAETRKSIKAPFEIYVDGGVNSGNIKDIEKAGADIAAVGSGLFKGNIEENMNKLKQVISKA